MSICLMFQFMRNAWFHLLFLVRIFPRTTTRNSLSIHLPFPVCLVSLTISLSLSILLLPERRKTHFCPEIFSRAFSFWIFIGKGNRNNSFIEWSQWRSEGIWKVSVAPPGGHRRERLGTIALARTATSEQSCSCWWWLCLKRRRRQQRRQQRRP